MKSCDMVIVVPVDKHTGNDEVLRLQAFGVSLHVDLHFSIFIC